MIEFGLEKSACRGQHKQISPTLHSTNIGGMDEEFLEVRYKGEGPSDHANKKVDVILNSTNPKKHVSRIHSTGRRSVSHEPESPEIPRDGDICGSPDVCGDLVVKSENDASEICDGATTGLLESNELEKTELNVNSVHRNLCSHTSLQRSLSLSTEKKAVRVERKRTMSCNIDELKEQVVVTDDSLNLTNITQIEVVQTGQMINNPESVINIEEYSHEMELNDDRMKEEETSRNSQHLSISLENSQTGRIHSSDSVEDLDSPESIIKIDREDCFSWEEDRLFLKIGELESDTQNTQEETRNSSTVDESVTGDDGLSGNTVESKAKTDGMRNGLDNINRDNSSSSLGSSTSDQSSNHSTPSKRAILKNKLTSAFGSFSKERRNKQPNQSRSHSSSPNHSEETASALLQEDEYGFPLAIFTKVRVLPLTIQRKYNTPI